MSRDLIVMMGRGELKPSGNAPNAGTSGVECLPGPESVIELIRPCRMSAERPFEERTVIGTIRTLRVDKGFGFIKDEKGQEYFFHQSAIYGAGIADLREGDSVEFEVGQGPKGPRAENVRRTST